DAAKYQSYFGFTISFILQSFLSLVALFGGWYWYDNHPGRNASFEMFCIALSAAFSVYILSIAALVVHKKNPVVLRLLQISVIFYIIYLVAHCIRFSHSLIWGSREPTQPKVYGLPYGLASIVLFAFALFKSSAIRVSMEEECRLQEINWRRARENPPLETPPPFQNRFGSSSSYATAPEYPS
ncbi:hypothetical protein PMAYCL1PPCAC_01604, partial [Pristionchus mayeri]